MASLLKPVCGLSATVALTLATTSPALAVDCQPFDWVPLPAGRDVFMGYYEYAEHNEFNNVLSGTAKGPTSLDANIGVARYLHYGLLGNNPYVLDVILPFGALTNGKIGGTRLDDASGVGDPIVEVRVDDFDALVRLFSDAIRDGEQPVEVPRDQN